MAVTRHGRTVESCVASALSDRIVDGIQFQVLALGQLRSRSM